MEAIRFTKRQVVGGRAYGFGIDAEGNEVAVALSRQQWDTLLPLTALFGSEASLEVEDWRIVQRKAA